MIILLLLTCGFCFGQDLNQTVEWKRQLYENLYKSNFKDSLTKYDFSLLWTETENSAVYGFVGSNYQRLRIKIISAKKDLKHPDTYNISGKSMVQNKISDFNGTIRIDSFRIYKQMHLGADEMYKDSGIQMQGLVIARYHFSVDSAKYHLGAFDGNVTSLWFIDKDGQLKYDDIELYSDYYNNNLFVGTWTNSKNEKVISNWGDYRAPYCGNLDIGAGGFSPSDSYLRYGWQTIRDAYDSDKIDSLTQSLARHEEERQWWKK